MGSHTDVGIRDERLVEPCLNDAGISRQASMPHSFLANSTVLLSDLRTSPPKRTSIWACHFLRLPFLFMVFKGNKRNTEIHFGGSKSQKRRSHTHTHQVTLWFKLVI